MESGGGSRMISFGENSNGMFPSMMMPPLTSHPYPHAVSSNTLFLPLPLPSSRDLNRHNGGGGSSMMIEENYNSTSTGFYLMESNTNDDGESCVVKAKIMAHPHYHRLLAAYVNCQKVKIISEELKSQIIHFRPVILLILSRICVVMSKYLFFMQVWGCTERERESLIFNTLPQRFLLNEVKEKST